MIHDSYPDESRRKEREPRPEPNARQPDKAPSYTKVEKQAHDATWRVIHDHFGDNPREAARLLREFAGLTITFPPPAVVETRLRDARVVSVLNHDPSTARVRSFGDIHGVPLRVIAKAFATQNGGVGLKQVRQDHVARAVTDRSSDDPTDDEAR